MKGKSTCKVLKDVRAAIAEANDIPLEIRECTYEGECRGTCPKCEAEVRYLEQELSKRRKLGKTVVLAGISAVMAIGTTGCEAIEKGYDALQLLAKSQQQTEETLDGEIDVLEGDVAIEIPLETGSETDEMIYEMGEIAEEEGI